MGQGLTVVVHREKARYRILVDQCEILNTVWF